MLYFESLLVALSTYSVLPVPQFEWNERNMKYALCFFPAVGVLCGSGLFGWQALCRAAQVSRFFFAAGAVCLPLLITGGIHMDGYLDTVDALSSHQSRERKLEILKDPHCGAFAVVYTGVYLLASLGLFYELAGVPGSISALCPLYCFSRALSGLCAVRLPNARKSGMLSAYTQNAQTRTVSIVLVLVALASGGAALWLSPFAAGGAILAGLAALAAYRKMALSVFGGVTGDTSGFFLEVCELACLAGAWAGGLAA